MNNNHDRLLLYLISQTSRQMTQFINRRLAEKGLDGLIASHGSILSVLYRHPGRITLSELAESVEREKSTVVPLVEKLVRLGYVEKTPGGHDGRSVCLALTARGRSLRPVFREISGGLFQTAWNHFSERDREALTEALQQVYRNFQEEADIKKART